MIAALEPNYPVLTFFFVKKFLFFEVLAILCLLRFIVGPWLSRFFALIALAGCLAALVLIFAPAIPPDFPEIQLVTGHELYPDALRLMNLYNGMAVPLAVSAVFLLSTFLRAGRAKWIDFIFLALLFMLLILWGVTTFVV